MTKNEIIRELIECNPEDIKSLGIIYFNRSSRSRVKYVYDYDFTSSLESRRELLKVLLSLRKLRDYVDAIRVEYFAVDVEGGDCTCRYFSNTHYVLSLFDFINSIKK